MAIAGTAFGQTHLSAKNGALVVVDPASDVAERHAAEELASYLGLITGGTITLSSSTTAAAKQIVVGRGTLARQLCPDIAWDKLGPEELILRSTSGGLVVAGGSDRGTLYAVYRLLGRLGVRWWSPWAKSVPNVPELSIPKLNVREGPALEYRAPYWRSALDPDWAVENGSNLAWGAIDALRGGGVKYAGFVHTYYPLVPPDPNFKLHPEWYSLIDGKRTADNAQLCTTNPELRAFVLDQVRKQLRANPDASIVSVSQNDCFKPCQCDKCRALVKAEGSESALVLDLANYVADGIKDEFPHVAVDTLAYQWSRHAPTHMRPRPNVIVRLCSIECDFGVPLDSQKNASFRDDVLAWSKLTDRLYAWDYVTNFGNYVQPMPDEAVLGPNVRFLADHGVKGLFEEGDYSSTGASMEELKAWLLAQMMWNPHADSKALTQEFLAGYYGAAAKPIADYLDLIDGAASTTRVAFAEGPEAPFLSYKILQRSEKLWQDAEAAVSGDSERLWRVKMSHQPIRYVFLRRWTELRKAAQDAGDPWLLPASPADAARDWLNTVTGPGPAGWSPVTTISEGGGPPADVAK